LHSITVIDAASEVGRQFVSAIPVTWRIPPTGGISNSTIGCERYRWGHQWDQTFIKDLRWIPRSLLGGGKRRFARGEAVCCLCKLYEAAHFVRLLRNHRLRC